jgi:hypothetical protein
MRFPEVAKSGVSLAFSIGVVTAICAVTWQYILVPYQTHPKRPVFANDLKPVPAPPPPVMAIKVPPKTKPTVKPSPTATPTPEAKYKGKVNASIGLVLRAEPSQSAGSVGGADFNAQVSILKETPDKEWVYIRQESTKEEGWVRIGNITKD